MKTLILHTPKGGSGKSTLAREIAVAAAAAGVQTALADMDPQGTTTGWYRRRQSKTPALVVLTADGNTTRIAEAGAELLVIDTPPGQPAFLTSLLARADVVLVPVRPTPDDLLAAAPIARSLAKHPAWAFVLSRVSNFLYGLHMSGTGSTVSPGALGLGTMSPNAALTIGSAGGTNDDGHLGFLGTAPALTACGTGSPAMDATANDASGTITEGASATGCVATFAVAYQTAPHCLVSSPSGNAFTSYTSSTTALTLVNASLSGAKYTYICTQ